MARKSTRGRGYVDPSNGTLPRAQERVSHAIGELARGLGLDPDELSGGRRYTWEDAWPPESTPFMPSRGGYGGRSVPPMQSRAERVEAVRLKNLMRNLEMRAPAKVGFCIQRKKRREVLFALRRAGFGGSAKKRHWNRSANSQYRCR